MIHGCDVEFIVAREHVNSSDRHIVRAIRDRLGEKCRRGPALREARKSLYRYALNAHHRNQRHCRELRL